MRARSRKTGSGGGLIAFALGVMAGGVTGLLCAPTSGKATRRRLQLKAQSLRRKAQGEILAFKRETAHKAEELRDHTTEWIAEHVHVSNGNGKRPVRHRALQHR